ncbi:MAG: nickel pincer cofactor biosynthesis protein LarB [Bacteroidetes bacterium]|nr:nickel pincer cofactor biosynthesis protein LarB [Bacteroidota bacterium]MCW5897231.1 nickel pincer cofactor biosynthesis protein LarB [Bacteroidota bacterium]
MIKPEVKKILLQFKQGKRSEEEVVKAISSGMVETLGFATVDHHREMRQGFPEVIFCEGKSEQQVAQIAKKIVNRGGVLFATRANPKQFSAVRKVVRRARYNAVARTISFTNRVENTTGRGTILIVTAGTSDLPVAEEAFETATIMGNDVDRLTDVGVAGIHRLLMQSKKLHSASVIIVVAGMDGALPSVVGGLVDVPVIAVPTSVGYGANFGGVAPLLAMLNSCAAGVMVANIDNGFGAGVAASRINRQRG